MNKLIADSSPNMPSGNTHDAVTFILAVPTGIITFATTESLAAAVIVTVAFLFGGLMFGPDLDTVSKQNSRWHFFRFIWLPYRSFFKHRSRWTHGLLFGTVIRVIYFMGVVTLLLFAASFCSALLFGTEMPRVAEFANAWAALGRLFRIRVDAEVVLLVFLGLWTGAASHTFSDMAGTYIKTGRTGGYL